MTYLSISRVIVKAILTDELALILPLEFGRALVEHTTITENVCAKGTLFDIFGAWS